jgi:hypothetical protein
MAVISEQSHLVCNVWHQERRNRVLDTLKVNVHYLRTRTGSQTGRPKVQYSNGVNSYGITLKGESVKFAVRPDVKGRGAWV